MEAKKNNGYSRQLKEVARLRRRYDLAIDELEEAFEQLVAGKRKKMREEIALARAMVESLINGRANRTMFHQLRLSMPAKTHSEHYVLITDAIVEIAQKEKIIRDLEAEVDLYVLNLYPVLKGNE